MRSTPACTWRRTVADRNRAERRRARRDGLIEVVRAGTAGESPDGRTIYSAVDAMPDRMPDKVPGRHRWIATAAWTLTDTEAAAAREGVTTLLTHRGLVQFGVGCVDCERTYAQAVTDPCPAGDEWSGLAP